MRRSPRPTACSSPPSRLPSCSRPAPALADRPAPVSAAAPIQLGRGTLVALPPIVQPGLTPAAAPTTGQVVATFTPKRRGHVVRLERLTDHGWRPVAQKRQDAWGSAAFAVPPGVYRAETQLGRGRVIRTGRVAARDWTPTFEDTFSGASLDAGVWNDQAREHESVYAPRTCARTDPAARRVEGGVLHLGIALDPARLDQRCAYVSTRGAGEQSFLLTSQVATEHTRLFGHGIAAARIKPQRAKGMHSGFWMLPQDTDFADGNPAAGTEIDVMEFFGETPQGRETIGSFVSYYEPGWRSVKHGSSSARLAAPSARALAGGRSSTSSPSSGHLRSTSSASTAGSTTARPMRSRSPSSTSCCRCSPRTTSSPS